MCSGITPGRVLNVELYTQRFQKLIYPHRRQKLTLFHTEMFSRSSEYLQGYYNQ